MSRSSYGTRTRKSMGLSKTTGKDSQEKDAQKNIFLHTNNKMVFRLASVTSLVRPLRCLSTLCHPGLVSSGAYHYRNSNWYKISRLHTSKTHTNQTNSPIYHSRKRCGFTIRENGESLEKQSPVVVILGWNNSQDKYLMKYSEMFEKRGYETVAATANPFNTFFRSGSKVKQTGHQILDILLEMNCANRPVFFYAFSNGGGAVFFQMTEALTIPQSKYYGKIKVAGSIFDSFPVTPEMKNVKIVQKTVTDFIRNPVTKGLVWYALGLSMPLVLFLSSTTKRYMHGLITSPLTCDQLVLFSKADDSAPYEDIEDFIDERRKRGIHVVSKCWEDSNHVSHFRKHPDEYSRVIYEFIDNCLKKM